MTTRIAATMIVVAAALMLAAPASAAKHQKRVYADTGPLIMSGTMASATSMRRSRAADICRPVVIKRRPMSWMVSR